MCIYIHNRFSFPLTIDSLFLIFYTSDWISLCHMKADALERRAFLPAHCAVMSLLYINHFIQLLEITQYHHNILGALVHHQRAYFKYKKNTKWDFPFADTHSVVIVSHARLIHVYLFFPGLNAAMPFINIRNMAWEPPSVTKMLKQHFVIMW